MHVPGSVGVCVCGCSVCEGVYEYDAVLCVTKFGGIACELLDVGSRLFGRLESVICVCLASIWRMCLCLLIVDVCVYVSVGAVRVCA